MGGGSAPGKEEARRGTDGLLAVALGRVRGACEHEGMSAQCKVGRLTLFARAVGTLFRPGPAEQTAGSLPGWDSDSALSPGWSRGKKTCGAGHGFRLGWLLDYFLLPFFFKPHSNYLNSNSIFYSSHTQINKIMHQHECTTC